MPIYEYRCTACGHTLETIQKLGARPLTKCPECAGKLEKLISRAAFQLKGGGWYSEGYGKSSSKPSSSSTDSSDSSGSSSDSTKPEKKKAAAGGGCGSGSCGCH